MGMNHDRNEVLLSFEWMDRCYEYGAGIVNAYTDGLNAASRAVSSHGAESNWKLQSIAKMGEVAFCLWSGIDPESLNWSQRCDNGFDALYGRLKIDVKTIHKAKRLLIWPVNKAGFYLTKKFQVLVLVKAEPPSFEVARWIDKAAFYCEKNVARETPGLTDGTWFIPEDRLWPIELLRHWAGSAVLEREL